MTLDVPEIQCVESGESFGRFAIEPLEKGVGITLGNALRRMLLGHLPGAAVTWIKIDGIQHEFSTIPYVKEDVIEFLLNVKELRLRAVSGRSGMLTLEAEGENQVFASAIQPSDDFEIANPELYLATLDSPEARLYIEFNVELGKGYRQASPSGNLPVGAIPVDSIFTPIRKVDFTTEPMHIGHETSGERLYLEVWTDGTISPIDAVSRGAGMLVELLSPFVNYVRVSEKEEEEEVAVPAVADEKYSMFVEELDLSVRTLNSLRRGGINTVGELLARGEKGLLSLRNFGQKSREEVGERLRALGLSLSAQEEHKTGGDPPEE